MRRVCKCGQEFEDEGFKSYCDDCFRKLGRCKRQEAVKFYMQRIFERDAYFYEKFKGADLRTLCIVKDFMDGAIKRARQCVQDAKWGVIAEMQQALLDQLETLRFKLFQLALGEQLTIDQAIIYDQLKAEREGRGAGSSDDS